MQQQDPPGKDLSHVPPGKDSNAEEPLEDESSTVEPQSERLILSQYSSEGGSSNARSTIWPDDESIDLDHEDGEAGTQRSERREQEERDFEARVKAERARIKWKRRTSGTKRALDEFTGSEPDDNASIPDESTDMPGTDTVPTDLERQNHAIDDSAAQNKDTEGIKRLLVTFRYRSGTDPMPETSNLLDSISNLDSGEEREREAFLIAERAAKRLKRRSSGSNKRTLEQFRDSDSEDDHFLASDWSNYTAEKQLSRAHARLHRQRTMLEKKEPEDSIPDDIQNLSQKDSSLDTDDVERTANEQHPEPEEDPLGLTVLYEPPDGAKADIVFVHGFGGSSIKSWCKDDNLETFWPRRFLPSDINSNIYHARIMTFGHNSGLYTMGGHCRDISEIALELLCELHLARETKPETLDIRNVPLFFVAHSLGGVIVKSAFLQGRDDPRYQDIIKAISALVFLSTPHSGLDKTEMLTRISRTYMPWKGNQELISKLTKGLSAQKDIDEKFRDFSPRVRIFSFYETVASGLDIDKKAHIFIVPKENAVLGLPGEEVIPLNANHKDMSKFGSKYDQNYIRVRDALISLLGEALVAEAVELVESTAGALAISHKQGESTADSSSSVGLTWIDKSTRSGFSQREPPPLSTDSGYTSGKSQPNKMTSDQSTLTLIEEHILGNLEEVEEEDTQSHQSVESFGDETSSTGGSLIDNDIQDIAQSLILQVLEEDEVLSPLIRQSLEKFDRHRVVKNLAGFMKGYCILLSYTQPTLNQKRTIRFFRRRRTQFANILCNNLDPSSFDLDEILNKEKLKALAAERKARLALWMTDHSGDLPPAPSIDDDDNGIVSSDESWSGSEGLPDVLEDIKVFLTDGEPLKLFRENFARFVAGDSIKGWNIMIKSKLQTYQDLQENKDAKPVISSSPLSSMVSPVSLNRFEAKRADSIVEIEDHGGFYVSWSCRCGRRFKARIAGSDRRAAEDFLQRMDWNVKRDGPMVTHWFNQRWLEDLLWILAPGLLDRFSFELPSMDTESQDLEAGPDSNLPQLELTPSGQENQAPVTQAVSDSAINEVDTKSDLVYVCLVNRESNNWRLKHAKVDRGFNIKTSATQVESNPVTQNMDRSLFLALRERLVRGLRGNRWYSPLVITGLEFWEFKLFYTAKLVTRIKKDKLPYEKPTAEPESSNTTPTMQLEEEWEYTPLAGQRLSDYKEVLNSEFLLHLLKYPGDALPESPVWTGLPRKIRTKLINRQPTPKTGWGFSVDHEWNTLAFTVAMCPVIILGFVLAIYLAIIYEWPVSAAITLALAPVTLIAFLDNRLKDILKQKSLSN